MIFESVQFELLTSPSKLRTVKENLKKCDCLSENRQSVVKFIRLGLDHTRSSNRTPKLIEVKTARSIVVPASHPAEEPGSIKCHIPLSLSPRVPERWTAAHAAGERLPRPPVALSSEIPTTRVEMPNVRDADD
ncbi:hypothetical protein WA026_001416 [Henosepilachna vigintioctopunctata]|uniref:Uncharacterized protein n=1 Tax=Henosepilachna vigintioctopunctata TaxID=420089 RepID=A0AAW1UI70_9CUCU